MNVNIDDNGIKDSDGLWKALLRSLLPIIAVIPLSVLIHTKFINYYGLFHTILELMCIFTSFFLFFSIWLAYDIVNPYYRVLGYGYLIVAIFDLIHAFYFLKIDSPYSVYNNYSVKFWMLGRFAQAIILYIYTQRIKIFKNETAREEKLKSENSKKSSFFFSKYFIITAILLVVFFISYCVVTINSEILLLTSNGVTLLKSILECIIILIFSLSLIKPKQTTWHKNLRKKNHFHNEYRYNYPSHYAEPSRHMILVLIVSILSEACFVYYPSIYSYNLTIGHILKVLANFLLLKSIILDTVAYPYILQLEHEHKNLKETLRETNELTDTLNEILDALPEAIIRFDNNSVTRHVNKKFEDLLGYSKDDLYGLVESDFLKITDAIENNESTMQEITMASDNTDNINNNTKSIIGTYKTKSGEKVKLRISKFKITSGTLMILHDIKKEQELKNINLQTQTILDAVSNMILMIDKNKKVVLCNKALEEVYGINKERIIGMDVSELYKIIDDKFRQFLDAALEGHESNQLHEASLLLDNKRKTLLLYITPIYNIDKDIIGAIIAGTDITELKTQQEALVQQEKLAVLGQMGAGIVHETRNFLSTIKGRIQLIDVLTENQIIKNHISKINNNIDELNMIMSEFLFLSKPRQSTLQEASMYDIVNSIKGMIEALSVINGVAVDFDLSDDEMYLLCDEAQIKQVILNICKNAIEAMADQKSARLKVSTGYNKQANEMFIKISDNGKGISKEDLDKIGTPFFTTKQKGTGLGLNICYGIIKEHKGRIEVESEIGKGTTFTILLPCISDEDSPDEENDKNEYNGGEQ